MMYKYRVKYTDRATGQTMLTGLCRNLDDAILKAALLDGVVVDDDEEGALLCLCEVRQ